MERKPEWDTQRAALVEADTADTADFAEVVAVTEAVATDAPTIGVDLERVRAGFLRTVSRKRGHFPRGRRMRDPTTGRGGAGSGIRVVGCGQRSWDYRWGR